MWEQFAQEFDHLAQVGDANMEWSFDTKRGIRHQWLLSDAPTSGPPHEFWELFAAAGMLLARTSWPPSMFPKRLLAEISADWRWLAALRHAGVNVAHFEPTELRSEGGLIHSVAAASAKLCRRLSQEADPCGQAASDHYASQPLGAVDGTVALQ